MTGLIVDIAAVKPDPGKRELDLAAIRTLAKHDALDLVPMLFAPLGPTYNPDVWAKKRGKK